MRKIIGLSVVLVAYSGVADAAYYWGNASYYFCRVYGIFC